MKLRDIFKKRKDRGVGWVLRGGSVTPLASMQLSAVYACVRVLADAMASLPAAPYKRDECGHNNIETGTRLAMILGCEPNALMTSDTLMRLMVQSMLLHGDGYAYIERDEKGDVNRLHWLPSTDVTVNYPTYIDEAPTYKVNGLRYEVPAADMIHILNYTDDGIKGKSTLAHAAESTRIAGYAAGAARDFYESGGSLAGVLSTSLPVTQKQEKELREKWSSLHGAGNRKGIAILDRGMSYSPISVPPRDAQLLESRKYSLEEICRFFQVSPQKIFDFTHSSYSTVEATELAFLNDTLRPLIVKFEQEFTRKLLTRDEREQGSCIRFDTAQLMRADKAGQAAYYSTMFNIGVLSVNDIRRDMDLPHVEGGDRHFVQVNLMELDKRDIPEEGDF